MKIRDLRDLSLEELVSKRKELSSELFNLRFQLAVNQLEKPSRITAAKREIARIETLLAEKQDKRG